MLKILWNGIKGSDGKLQRASISMAELTSYPKGTATIYAKTYTRFSDEVRAAFKVENNSDSQADYFESDLIRVLPDHPLYAAVRAAAEKREARSEAQYAKQRAKYVEGFNARYSA